MAIKQRKEVNRLPGTAYCGTVLGGQPIGMVDASFIGVINGSMNSASYTVLGLAIETTTAYGSTQVNNMNIMVLDSFVKGNLISAFIDGGEFDVWDDGRGDVFESDVVNAAQGRKLYVSANGLFTTTQGSASTIGYVAVASIVTAPTSTSGVLTLKWGVNA